MDDKEEKPEMHLLSSACLFSRSLFLRSSFGGLRAFQLRKVSLCSHSSGKQTTHLSCNLCLLSLLTSGNVESLSKDRVVTAIGWSSLEKGK